VMRECATNERVVCNWVDLLQVSSVQFMCCEHILTARQQLAANRTSCCSTDSERSHRCREPNTVVVHSLHFTLYGLMGREISCIYCIPYTLRGAVIYEKNIQAPISCLFNFGLMSKCLVICSVVPVDLVVESLAASQLAATVLIMSCKCSG